MYKAYMVIQVFSHWTHNVVSTSVTSAQRLYNLLSPEGVVIATKQAGCHCTATDDIFIVLHIGSD